MTERVHFSSARCVYCALANNLLIIIIDQIYFYTRHRKEKSNEQLVVVR